METDFQQAQLKLLKHLSAVYPNFSEKHLEDLIRSGEAWDLNVIDEGLNVSSPNQHIQNLAEETMTDPRNDYKGITELLSII